jgi:hypothetical protein
MSRTKEFVEELQRIHNGDAWHGSSLLGISRRNHGGACRRFFDSLVQNRLRKRRPARAPGGQARVRAI